ncbi:unnamed protein product [Nyctereutes procyonoides]|uniref:(raccoon dog) hypothetical protein n=1 Tax=Nyctereutes procyonoides TaxID=34880 RepID=A0A811ZG76_NYCPR|nr:unnamed protein product [Nyctereutes procyonoides]
MAEGHRQIQNQLEEMLKSFHDELLTQLEQKVELDSRYPSAELKKYQPERRSKGDALDKCQAKLKKLRKKSQGSKTPQKCWDKEPQHMDNYVSDGDWTALTEQRRRFCFPVEKQRAVAKNPAAYHPKGKGPLAPKLRRRQQPAHPQVPARAVQLMQRRASSGGSVLPSALSASKCSRVISDPIPGAEPLQVPPALAPFVGRLSAQERTLVLNGISRPDGEDYSPWAERDAAQPQASSPPATGQAERLRLRHAPTLPRSSSLAESLLTEIPYLYTSIILKVSHSYLFRTRSSHTARGRPQRRYSTLGQIDTGSKSLGLKSVSIHPFIHPSILPSIYPSIHLSIYLPFIECLP